MEQETLEQEFYDVNESCKILNIGRTLFYDLVRENNITLGKAGRKTLVSVDVINFLKNVINNASNRRILTKNVKNKYKEKRLEDFKTLMDKSNTLGKILVDSIETTVELVDCVSKKNKCK